jgi:hypothetical protein
VKPLKDEWWLHEALLELNDGLGEYKGTVFPPKLPAGYEEPQGLEFARYAHWKKIDGEIEKFLASTINPLPQLTNNPLGAMATKPEEAELLISPNSFFQGDRTMQSPLLASNSLPSPWTSKRAAIPSPQIFSRMTQPDYGFPASQWSRRLTGFNPSSLFNTYLRDSHVLTEYQMGHFTAVVHANYVVNKNVSPSTMATNIANTWNQRHVKMAAEGNPGLGGLLTVRKVHILLKKSTEEVMGQQLLAASRKPPTKPQQKAKVKYVVGVTNAQTGKLADGRDLTAALMGDALCKANQSIPNQKERRRQNLLKFFAKAKKDTKIAFWS